MKREHFLYSLGGLCLVLAAVSLYFLIAPSADLQATEAELARLAGGGAGNSANGAKVISENRTDGKKGLTVERSYHVEKVDPAQYSSNPSKADYEKEIIKLADRLDLPDAEKVTRLLAMFPTLPPEGQVLVMENATKLIPDEQYVQMRPRLYQMAQSPELRETVKLDVLTRGESVRMPSLVELLRVPTYAEKEEVREILTAYLDVDYGNDAVKWEGAVRRFLAENPDL